MPGISRAGVGRSKVKLKRFIKFYYYKYRYYPGYHISRYYQLPSMPCRPAFIAGGQNMSFTLPPGAPYHFALSIRRCLPSGQKDVLELTRGQLLEEGIFICQHKTNKKQIKAWSDRLRAGIAMAEALPLKPGLSSLYVLHQSTGGKYTRDAFHSAWAKARSAASAVRAERQLDFTFHDIKAKGISDRDGKLRKKQNISGHKSISQTARYDRKVKIVPVVGNQ
ncbi:hypothetical protein ACR6A7_09330 [Pantoea sp. RRHST58]|uniref:hypothetical protein n=1 Tax=Pantoea sp. RRHST58 TaxID=3425183 RepID=UPI003D9FC9D7